MPPTNKEKKLRLAAWIISCAFLIFCICFYLQTTPMTVHFIDVDQGDACLIRAGRGGTVLIDGGDLQAGRTLESYFRLHNVRSLDAVMLSHFHDDHADGIRALLENDFPIGKLYIAKYTGDSELEEQLLSLAKEKGVPIERLEAGEVRTFGRAEYTVLWPKRKWKGENLNDVSMVVRMQCRGVSFLFTGDLESGAARVLAAEAKDALTCDVLKVPHHGGISSTQEDFIRACAVDMAVISVGRDNLYHEPSNEMLSLLQKEQIGVWRTDLDHTVVMTIGDGEIANVRTYRPITEGRP